MKKKITILIIIVIFALCGMIIVLQKGNESSITKKQSIKNKNMSGQYSNVKVTNFASAQESLKNILEELKIKSIGNELQEDTIDTTGNVTNTYRFNQIHNGIKVYNGGLIIYTDKNGTPQGIVNNMKNVDNIDVTIKSNSEELNKIIKDKYKETYSDIENEEIILYELENGDFTLAHKYTVKLKNYINDNEIIIIDDSTKNILETSNVAYGIVAIDYDKFLMGDKYVLADEDRGIFLLEQENGILDEKHLLNSEVYSWNKNGDLSKEGQSYCEAIDTVQKCYDYYKNKFDYISFNGTGFKDENKNEKAQIRLATNVKTYYGDNKSDTLLCLPASSMIVIGSKNLYNDNVECLGHEYTHCIFYNRTGSDGSNASLENQALNEAYSDIMGMCIEAHYNNSPKIDGNISTQNGRDIKNSKAVYKDFNNWIKKDKYYYSTIISKAAYFISQEITLDRFEELWFESMKLLGKNAEFDDCYYAVVETARLKGFSDEEISVIENSFTKVGINANDLNEIRNLADNKWNNTQTNIVGKWKSTGTNNNIYSLGELYGSAFSYANELTFREDGTYRLAIGVTYDQEGNYEIDGNIIKLTNTQYKGNNPDKKIAEKFIIKNENDKRQIILEEKTEDNIIVNIIFENAEDIQLTENNNSSNNNMSNTLKAGDYYLEYGTYKNITLSSDVPQGGTYTINEDGTFSCTTSQGTANGTYKIEEETYENSGMTFTDCMITFKSSNTNIMNANTSWIINGNDQFSGVQSGGIFKYMGK